MKNGKNEKSKSKNVGFHGKNSLSEGSIPGINDPEIELPAFNPPVPNRAWTAMRDELCRDNVDPAERE